MTQLHRLMLAAALVLSLAAVVVAQPKPSPYPISWELQFEHSKPKRIVVTPPGSDTAQAYWYMTFTVTNLGRSERTFIPVFEMLLGNGQVIRSDGKRYHSVDGQIVPVTRTVKLNGQEQQVFELVPGSVLQAIRAQEKKPHLESVTEIGTTIRLGEDQAREGVAIWPEPKAEMGRFSIFVSGLSGEAEILKDSKGEALMRERNGRKEPIVLRKTLRLDYVMLGDDRYPGNDPVEYLEREWVMK